MPRALNRVIPLSLSFIACILGTAQALDEVSYEALVDKKQATLGENVQYLVRINYAFDTMAPSITPPSFGDFTILNEYQNTQETGTGPDKHLVLKKMWLLKPEVPGHLSIASCIITYQDPTTNLLKTGKTLAQFVDVSPTAEAASAPVPRPSAVSAFVSGWPWLAAVLGAVALGLSLTQRRRKPAPAPVVPAETLALAALAKTVDHLEQEDLQGYFVDLTRVLYEYLQAKYRLEPEGLSTAALLAALRDLGFGSGVAAPMEAFFKTAEKAKFAGYVPEEAEIAALHETLRKFIEAGRGVAPRSGAAPKRLGRPRPDEEDD